MRGCGECILTNMVMLHILLAVISVGLAFFTLIHPTQKKIQANLALLAGTIVSGVGLVIVTPAHMAHACLSGLMYLGIVSAVLVVARRRLQKGFATA